MVMILTYVKGIYASFPVIATSGGAGGKRGSLLRTTADRCGSPGKRRVPLE